MADLPDRSPAPPRSSSPALSRAARERVVAQLAEAFAQDRLSLEEYDERVTSVYRATSADALRALTADLVGTGLTSAPTAMLQHRIAGAFTSVERSGRVSVPTHVEIRVVMSNVVLDLREAHFAPGVTEIALRSVFASVELRLPAGIVVEDQTENVLSSFESKVRRRGKGSRTLPGLGSVVRITGRAVLSSVSAIVEKSAVDEDADD